MRHVHLDESILNHLEDRISCWQRMSRIVATLRRFINNLKSKRPNVQTKTTPLDIEEIKASQTHLIKMAQKREYADEIKDLQQGRCLKNSSTILPLSPYLDDDGCLRVGGRLSVESLSHELVHPLLIPKCRVAVLIARWCHLKVCLLYTSPSPRDKRQSRMPSSA